MLEIQNVDGLLPPKCLPHRSPVASTHIYCTVIPRDVPRTARTSRRTPCAPKEQSSGGKYNREQAPLYRRSRVRSADSVLLKKEKNSSGQAYTHVYISRPIRRLCFPRAAEDRFSVQLTVTLCRRNVFQAKVSGGRGRDSPAACSEDPEQARGPGVQGAPVRQKASKEAESTKRSRGMGTFGMGGMENQGFKAPDTVGPSMGEAVWLVGRVFSGLIDQLKISHLASGQPRP